MIPLLIIGSRGHAAVIIEAVELQGVFRIAGLLDSFEPKGVRKHGYSICGTLEESAEVAHTLGCHAFFIAIGDNWQRSRIASLLKSNLPGVEFPVVLYPNVVISASAKIGPGSVVMPNVVILANSSLGEGCIVNAGSTVNHDCRIDDYASLASGVHLGGGCVVGSRSHLGPGAVLREKCSIGRDTVVGAGSAVLRNLPDEVLAYGVPARVIRPRKPDEPYLR